MPTKKQEQSINYQLMDSCRLRRNITAARLSELNLYPGQDGLLYNLREADGQTMSELVEKMCIQHATLFNMVERMEASGFVLKEKDAADKRTSRIYLSQKGKDITEKLVLLWRKMDADIVKGFSPDEAAMLLQLLKKVNRNLGKHK